MPRSKSTAKVDVQRNPVSVSISKNQKVITTWRKGGTFSTPKHKAEAHERFVRIRRGKKA